jgi:hypothetical protein
MKLRMIRSLLASLAAAGVLAGSASAIPTAGDEPWGGDASTYFEQSDDDSGSVYEYEVEPEYEQETLESDPGIVCGGGGETYAATLATTGPSTFLASSDAGTWTASEGDACASGAYRPSCNRVEVKVRKKTLLRLSVAFEWVVEKEWCWDYPKVTWWRVRSYPTHVDRFMYYRGVVGEADSHFTWCCFSTKSGHRTYRMGWFENCLPLRGCMGSWYPRIRVETYGNGRYRVTQRDA